MYQGQIHKLLWSWKMEQRTAPPRLLWRGKVKKLRVLGRREWPIAFSFALHEGSGENSVKTPGGEGFSSVALRSLFLQESVPNRVTLSPLHFLSFLSDSDVSATDEDYLAELQEAKLKLMLGLLLMTLFLFVILLAICSAVMYKMKTMK